MNPYPHQPKVDNYDYGRAINKMFLKKNDIAWIEPILIKKYENITGNTSKHIFRGQFWGRSRDNIQIHLNLSKCMNPINFPGYSWSYTGSKIDITPAGVLSHEVGHYVDFLHNWRLSHKLGWLINSEKVSNYEPNDLEKFAESMRVFILNPDLLKQGCPDRYEKIIEFGLKPVIKKTWDKVLENAHPQLISSLDNWIKMNRKNRKYGK